jgi:hypothetical protein
MQVPSLPPSRTFIVKECLFIIRLGEARTKVSDDETSSFILR